MRPHSLASPLTGTACMLAGLGLLAIPLHQLTSTPPTPPAPTQPAEPSTREIPAVLRLRLLTPAQRITCKSTTGKSLLDLQAVPAGISEYDVLIPLGDGVLEWMLDVELGDDGPETAVFLTVMPDGYDDQTRYAIGKQRIHEPLRYEWPSH